MAQRGWGVAVDRRKIIVLIVNQTDKRHRALAGPLRIRTNNRRYNSESHKKSWLKAGKREEN